MRRRRDESDGAYGDGACEGNGFGGGFASYYNFRSPARGKGEDFGDVDGDGNSFDLFNGLYLDTENIDD